VIVECIIDNLPTDPLPLVKVSFMSSSSVGSHGKVDDQKQDQKDEEESNDCDDSNGPNGETFDRFWGALDGNG